MGLSLVTTLPDTPSDSSNLGTQSKESAALPESHSSSSLSLQSSNFANANMGGNQLNHKIASQNLPLKTQLPVSTYQQNRSPLLMQVPSAHVQARSMTDAMYSATSSQQPQWQQSQQLQDGHRPAESWSQSTRADPLLSRYRSADMSSSSMLQNRFTGSGGGTAAFLFILNQWHWICFDYVNTSATLYAPVFVGSFKPS